MLCCFAIQMPREDNTWGGMARRCVSNQTSRQTLKKKR